MGGVPGGRNMPVGEQGFPGRGQELEKRKKGSYHQALHGRHDGDYRGPPQHESVFGGWKSVR